MKKVVDFIKNSKYFFAGILVLIFVVWINAFPKDYVFAGGDTPQFINLKENFRARFYEWSGSAIFYYFIFYLLDLAGFSNSMQLSFNVAFIIFGAYFSFYFFASLIFPKISNHKKVLISLFYALNLYTLFLFSGNWGFSYFPSLYVFIPALAGLFIKFLKTEKFIFGVWFCLIVFLASSGFGNPAFALSFAIFCISVFFCLAIFKNIKINRKIIAGLFFITFCSFLASAFWILPIVPQMKGGVEGLETSNVLNFDEWIVKTASPIWNTVSLNHFSETAFPFNFPYKSLYFLKSIFLAISFLPFALIVFGLFLRKSNKEKRLYLAFLFLSALFVLLIARVTAPFEVVNYYIYHIWGFSVLRGFDKTAIYFPFIAAVMLLMILEKIKNKKIWLTIIIIILLIPLPFYLGKIQQNLSYRFANAKPENKDFRKSGLSFLVKIPDEYHYIKNIFNGDKNKYFIATLPYHTNDGSGVVQFKKWKLYGWDITQFIYNKPYISSNTAYFKDWSFAENFNENFNENNDWSIKTLGMMNAKYIIYHKDVPEDYIKKSENKILDLEKNGLIENLNDNEYFTLYKINSDYILPYISWQKENVNIESNPESVEKEFDKIKSLTASADFKEINPKKFEVTYTDNDFSRNIILAETFNPMWKAYYLMKNGEEIEIKDHFLARGYANGWKLEKNDNIQKIIIEYYPTRLMWRGIWISGITVLCLIIYLLRYYYVKKRTV